MKMSAISVSQWRSAPGLRKHALAPQLHTPKAWESLPVVSRCVQEATWARRDNNGGGGTRHYEIYLGPHQEDGGELERNQCAPAGRRPGVLHDAFGGPAS